MPSKSLVKWDSFRNLNEENWQELKDILTGSDRKKQSVRAARLAIGINKAELEAWIVRSRQKRSEDPPWIHEIHEVFDNRLSSQADTLEDELWDRALNGVEEPIYFKGEIVGHKTRYDNNLALRLLSVRNAKYRNAGISKLEEISLESEDLQIWYRKFVAHQRIEAAKELAEDPEMESPALKKLEEFVK